MKRIFYNENLSGSGLVTGRAIRFIRDSDGAEIDLSEIGQTGKYLADPIAPGIWSVWDVTDGSPGVNLDQKVDVLSSTLIAEQITFPVPPDGNKFLAGDETFKELGIANVDGLADAIAAKQNEITTGNAAHAYFGNKTFRAITLDDLPSGVGTLESTIKSMYCEFDGVPGALEAGNIELKIAEIIKNKSYALTVKSGGNASSFSSAGTYPRRIKATPSIVAGDLLSRFLSAIVANSFIGYSAILNVNLGTGAAKTNMSPFSMSYDGTYLYINFGNWEIYDLYGAVNCTGVMING